MKVETSHLVIVFIILVIVMGYTMVSINNFMPLVESCSDDFAVINKCGCFPGNYSKTFPNAPKDMYGKE